MEPETRVVFPNLNDADFIETSQDAVEYNRVAHAAGATDQWWWPSLNSYWPPGVPREPTLEAFAEALSTLGYEPCDTDVVETEIEKIAVYADQHGPQHVARQLAGGRWTSKLGRDVDITHVDLNCLEDGAYGKVVLLLKRARLR